MKNYPNFPYPPEHIVGYVLLVGTFIISLHKGQIVQHTPADAEDFKTWLQTNGIRDIRANNNSSKKQGG